MRKFKIILFTVICLFLFSCVANAEQRVWSVQSVPQRTRYWCWAATAEMLGRWVNPSGYRDQVSVVINRYGYINESGGCPPNESMARAINYAANGTYYKHTPGMPYSFIELKNNYLQYGPVGVYLSGTAGGHYQVINGYLHNGSNDEDNYVRVIDPWSNLSNYDNGYLGGPFYTTEPWINYYLYYWGTYQTVAWNWTGSRPQQLYYEY